MACLIYWNTSFAFLQNIDIRVHENVLQFRGNLYSVILGNISREYNKSKDRGFSFVCAAQGYGAKGHHEYHFSLELLLPVKPEVCVHVVKIKEIPGQFMF